MDIAIMQPIMSDALSKLGLKRTPSPDHWVHTMYLSPSLSLVVNDTTSAQHLKSGLILGYTCTNL